MLSVQESPEPAGAEPIEYGARKLTTVLVLLGSVAFVVCGFFMLRDPNAGPKAHLAGILGIVFFGLCAALSVRELAKPRVKLRIDDIGIHSTNFVKASDFSIPWAELASVRVVVMKGQPLLVLYPCDAEWGLNEGSGATRSLKRANYALVGSWLALSPRTYGLKAGVLLETINRRYPGSAT